MAREKFQALTEQMFYILLCLEREQCGVDVIERRLEKLAARGWLLEKAANWGWHLRRGEPQAVKYAVTYFPAASVFDGSVTAGQETYADYCQAGGWEFVSAYGPIQYFRSTRPDPVPIETDEGEKLRTIHRTMLKTLVFSHGLLLVVWLVNLAMRISDSSLTPLSTLASNRDLLFLALLAAFGIYLSAMLVDYFIWYARSRRAVERSAAATVPAAGWRNENRSPERWRPQWW